MSIAMWVVYYRVREMKRKLHEARLNALAGEDDGGKGSGNGSNKHGGSEKH